MALVRDSDEAPIVQMRKLRPREVQSFVQSHTAKTRQRQGSNPSGLTLESTLSSTVNMFISLNQLIFLNLSKAVSVKSGDGLITLFLISI